MHNPHSIESDNHTCNRSSETAPTLEKKTSIDYSNSNQTHPFLTQISIQKHLEYQRRNLNAQIDSIHTSAISFVPSFSWPDEALQKIKADHLSLYVVTKSESDNT